MTFVHVHNHNRNKLDLRAFKCVFPCYSLTKKGASVMILYLVNCLLAWMLPSLKINPIFPKLLFGKRTLKKKKKNHI